MKYQNKLKEIESAGHYKVPSIFMAVAVEADKEIEALRLASNEAFHVPTARVSTELALRMEYAENLLTRG